MSRRIRILVLVLLVALVILIVATIHFSTSVSRTSESQDDIVSETQSAQIFREKDGGYGFIDEYGNTILEPNWENLEFLTSSYVLATTQTDDGKRVGVFDMEGDLIVPFVYEEIRVLGDSYFVAEFPTKRCILYDDTFSVVDGMTWDRASETTDGIDFVLGDDTYSYGFDETLSLRSIQLLREAKQFTLSGTIPAEYASQLSPSVWSGAADLAEEFFTLLLAQDKESLAKLCSDAATLSVLELSRLLISGDITVTPYTSETKTTCLVWQASVSGEDAEKNTVHGTISVTMEASATSDFGIVGVTALME